MIPFILAGVVVAWSIVGYSIYGYIYANNLKGSTVLFLHLAVIGVALVCGCLEESRRTCIGPQLERVLSVIWYMVIINWVIAAILFYGLEFGDWKGRILGGFWIGLSMTCAIIFTHILLANIRQNHDP